MTGGRVFVYDPRQKLARNVNHESVAICAVSQSDSNAIKTLIERHVDQTGSTYADDILHRWQTAKKDFVKVRPTTQSRLPAPHFRDAKVMENREVRVS